MLNVRLQKDLEKKLEKYSTQKHLTKSQVVKEALIAYLSKADIDASAFDLGEDLFGTVGSDRTDASTTYKSRIKEKLRAKHSH